MSDLCQNCKCQVKERKDHGLYYTNYPCGCGGMKTIDNDVDEDEPKLLQDLECMANQIDKLTDNVNFLNKRLVECFDLIAKERTEFDNHRLETYKKYDALIAMIAQINSNNLETSDLLNIHAALINDVNNLKGQFQELLNGNNGTKELWQKVNEFSCYMTMEDRVTASDVLLKIASLEEKTNLIEQQPIRDYPQNQAMQERLSQIEHFHNVLDKRLYEMEQIKGLVSSTLDRTIDNLDKRIISLEQKQSPEKYNVPTMSFWDSLTMMHNGNKMARLSWVNKSFFYYMKEGKLTCCKDYDNSLTLEDANAYDWAVWHE